MASVCQWDDRAKLINLTTRLKGQAFAFFRTCTPQQRGSYGDLKAQLQKRFTPVRVQAVQSGLFHERKQKTQEMVDAFAQELRRLFYLAYPKAQQGSRETEEMGTTVLVYQFISGLKPEIKSKVAGVEGSLEQLLIKARFEEAKQRDLGVNQAARPKSTPLQAPQTPPGGDRQVRRRTEETEKQCFHCKGFGHIRPNYPLQGRALPVESQSRGGWTAGKKVGGHKSVNALVPDVEQAGNPAAEQRLTKVEELRQALREAELEESLAKAATTMDALGVSTGREKAPLGPTLHAVVMFEGMPVKALVDTGSPAAIVSLEFLLDALAKQRKPGQAPEEWKTEIRARLRPPSITLHNYGGDELRILRQVSAHISRASY